MRDSWRGSTGERAVALVAIAFLAVTLSAAGDEFAARKARRLAECMAIPANEYSTGMIFNPRGYRTMYHRSQCIQSLAVEERDADLCADVRERKSLLFDGSGVSPAHCRELVAGKRSEDEAALESFPLAGTHRIDAIEIERDGNGRDFDLVVSTRGSLPYRYDLRITAHVSAGKPVEIVNDNAGLGSTASRRILLLRAADLADALGDGWRQKAWTIVATLTLAKTGENRFFYERIPRAARESRAERTVIFEELPAWTPH